MRGFTGKIIVAAAIAVAFPACATEPVEWGQTVYTNAPAEPVETTSTMAVPSPSPCPGSVRTFRSGPSVYATWWDIRDDSSAVLLVSRSASPGGGWARAVAADSADRSARGCNRPPPAIHAHSARGYVYLAYFAEPEAGSGVFFVHSMDDGATFHEPFPIVFGRNPSRTGISARGDRVAVAYEDPNSVQPRVAIALSRTEGHLFEERMVASSQNVRAKQPVVRLAGDTIRVWWSEYSPIESVSATRAAYREGIWR